MTCPQSSGAARLLVVPGLHDSGPTHWQSWLQGLHRGAVRVQQRDWSRGDLERWSARIANTVERHGGETWVVAAHSFGCLALAHHLAANPGSPIVAALLVAPADPDRFGIAGSLPAQRLPRPTTMVTSSSDPWMRLPQAQAWARRWGSQLYHLGDAGHINTESGFGPFPYAQRWVAAAQQKLARERRFERAAWSEWSFAI